VTKRSIHIAKGVPAYATVNSKTNIIYISYPTSNFILAVDLNNGSINAKIRANTPGNIVVNSVTNKVYVSSSDGIVEIDGSDNQYVVINIGLPRSGGSVEVNTTTHLLYTTCFGHDIMTVIDPAKQAIDEKIPVEKNPKGVAFDTRGHKIYVANRDSNSVSIIDSNSKKLIDTLDLSSSRSEYGAWPEIVVTNAKSNLLYVQRSGVLSGGGGGTTITDLLVIDTINRGITNERQIHGGAPLEKMTFALNSGNNTVCVTNFSLRKGYTVAKLDSHAREVLKIWHFRTKWWKRISSFWGWASEPISINSLTNKAYVVDSSNSVLYELEA
jgi:YVTN family beta-propeller protein